MTGRNEEAGIARGKPGQAKIRIVGSNENNASPPKSPIKSRSALWKLLVELQDYPPANVVKVRLVRRNLKRSPRLHLLWSTSGAQWLKNRSLARAELVAGNLTLTWAGNIVSRTVAAIGFWEEFYEN